MVTLSLTLIVLCVQSQLVKTSETKSMIFDWIFPPTPVGNQNNNKRDWDSSIDPSIGSWFDLNVVERLTSDGFCTSLNIPLDESSTRRCISSVATYVFIQRFEYALKRHHSISHDRFIEFRRGCHTTLKIGQGSSLLVGSQS